MEPVPTNPRITIRDDRLPLVKMLLFGLVMPTLMLLLLVGAFMFTWAIAATLITSLLHLVAAIPGLGFITNNFPVLFVPVFLVVPAFIWGFKHLFRRWDVSEPGRLAVLFILGIVAVDALTAAIGLDVLASEVMATVGGLAVAFITVLVSRLPVGTLRQVILLVVVLTSIAGIVLGVGDFAASSPL